ncbi:aspartate-semialdehyde dehydrogenase [Buchnera aphidicola (Kurisakia onigurumii)]|uniref:aspartate-semialdehyde dehydrogenase n=1 Tax=Buchnera aphidicola TaxID=9 RepID=UPI0031B6DBFE
MMNKVGFVGWRGMVGSVLMHRMEKKNDFFTINPIFFSTSQIGQVGPKFNNIQYSILKNAYDIDVLKEMDIIISCQGSIYTKDVYFSLRKNGWKGYWIDAASYLRMNQDSVIVLDPINKLSIKNYIEKGYKTFVGSNCTVSLMLLALGGLFQNNLVEWINISTYQAASGAGSLYMLELLKQMGYLYDSISNLLNDSNISILKMDKIVSKSLQSNCIPKNYFKTPLAGSVIPWIDEYFKNGQTKEESKIEMESNKILENKNKINIDGICVRVGTMRCHSQSFTIKLKQNISISNIEEIITNNNKWVKIIPNTKELSIKKLNPVYTSGTLNIPIGRLRKLSIGKKYLSAFSVGDQLLWGAAEPLRRMLKILVKK